MLFAPVALLIGLAAAVLPTQAIELAPPDHVQVHYPNGTIAEGSNFTIGLDPPAFAANYSGFHYIANISAQFPDGSIHDLLNISSLSCHGEEIYNETLEASGNGLYNVSLKATEEGNYTLFWNITYGYPAGSQHETGKDAANVSNCDPSTLVYESWVFNTTVLSEEGATATATEIADQFSLLPEPTGDVIEGDTSGAMRSAGLSVVGLVSAAVMLVML